MSSLSDGQVVIPPGMQWKRILIVVERTGLALFCVIVAMLIPDFSRVMAFLGCESRWSPSRSGCGRTVTDLADARSFPLRAAAFSAFLSESSFPAFLPFPICTRSFYAVGLTTHPLFSRSQSA